MTSQFNSQQLRRLAIFQDRINGTNPNDHAPEPVTAYAIDGENLYMIYRASRWSRVPEVGSMNPGDILAERTTVKFDEATGAFPDVQYELAITTDGPHSEEPERIQTDGQALIRSWFNAEPERFEQLGIGEQPGNTRLEIEDGARLPPYGWTEAYERTLERMMRERPEEIRLSMLQREINSEPGATAWFLESNGYDLHKIVWENDNQGRFMGYHLEHAQFEEPNSMSDEADPDRRVELPSIEQIAHSDYVPVDPVSLSDAEILERSRQVVEGYQTQRVRDGGPAAAGMRHDIAQSGIATTDRPAVLQTTGENSHPVFDLDSPVAMQDAMVETMEQDIAQQQETLATIGQDAPQLAPDAPARPVVWPRVNFPNRFVTPFQRTARDGREYEMMTVAIPRGVTVNGVELGGWRFDRFMHGQERTATANHRPVTVTFRPGEPVNLWRGSGANRETLAIDEPWDLCRAVKAERDAYQQAREQTRQQQADEQREDAQIESQETPNDAFYHAMEVSAARELALYIENSDELAADLAAARSIADPQEAAQQMGKLADRASLAFAHDPDFCGIEASTPDETPFDSQTRQQAGEFLLDLGTRTMAIDENAARLEKQSRSLDDYEEGSATIEYDAAVQEVRDLAESRKQDIDASFHGQLDQLTDRYATLLAQRTNDFNTRSAAIPSPMITGPANYPAAKMQQKTDALMRHYNEQSERLDTLRERIETIGADGKSISSAQPDALQQLQEKLSELQARQETMKQENQQARDRHEDAPHSSSELRNNNASMRRVQARIEGIQRNHDAGRSEQSGTTMQGEPFDLVHDGESGYVYFRFEDKPSGETRDMLKHNGFHWSIRESRWQRKMTGSAEFAVQRILEQAKPLEATQPAAPDNDLDQAHERQHRQRRHGAR
ncbi:hypothetical protein [Bifidobacterium tibiigranuli]|jgi:hypothetical protein|uniref:hypothetical protein n=1 Tax=Bifidobacterium tibiigranuli TaxID=2172043 RepID=UPI0026F00EA1|nr:hypothetical protein [Bifidobacterium tibiigranuli]MCI1712668.1 hypothetical protein [Bifidobacterium tibiigranuli]